MFDIVAMESEFIYTFKVVKKSVAAINLLEVGQNIVSLCGKKAANPKKQYKTKQSK